MSRKKYQTTFSDEDEKEIDRMLSVTPYVFVYGTLKQSHGNNRLLRQSEFIGEDTTKEGWLLGNAGVPYAFPPAVVPDEYKELLRPIKGEVYKVTDKRTAWYLDALEGWHPNKDYAHYWRRVIKTTNGFDAWIYTREEFGSARRCNKCSITEQGEWQWP